MDYQRIRVVALLMLLSSTSAVGGPSNDSATALFDVGIDHELSDPQATFDEVRALILERYYSREITEASLYWGAREGMLRRISPPKTPTQGRIWTAQQYTKIRRGLKGQRNSLGIRSHYAPKDASLTVTYVSPGSLAHGKLRQHDRIMRIDGTPLRDLTGPKIDAMLTNDGAPYRAHCGARYWYF